MNNDKLEIDTKMDKNKLPELDMPSEEALQSEMSRLDKIYTGTLKNKLEELRKMEFTGTSENQNDEEGSDASCSIKMTSQYQALEVNINPSFLLNTLNEAQISTQNIEIDQLVHICVALGESARLAFNNAKEKTHKGSETVFNHLMEEMQNELFDTNK